MAKKTVAEYKKNSVRDYVKVIKVVKNSKGNWSFDEKLLRKDIYEKATLETTE